MCFTKSNLLFSGLAVTALMLSSQLSFSQTALPANPSEVQLLRALLDEMKLLRMTLRESYVLAFQTRVLGDQLVEQRRRVTQLGEHTEALKSRLEELQKDDGADQQIAAQLRSACDGAADASAKAKCVQDYETFAKSVDQKRQAILDQIEADRIRYQKLSSDLANEQRGLVAIEQQLAGLEQRLTTAVSNK